MGLAPQPGDERDPAARRLAAIVAADVAGYSRLMELDEARTARTLREHRAAIDPIVTRYGGRIVKTTGDGVLLEFPSIVAALECAVIVQETMADRNKDVPEDRRMLFRLGINLGDVLIQDEDILGDGVNIAARLEGIAEPGGICVSDDVYRQVSGKLDLSFDDLGDQHLKNIARPVRAFRARIGDVAQGAPAPLLTLPDRPSIAVLPFANLSGDIEQEYFADGIVEDIIAALSRFKSLFVIARNSSFTFKGKVADVKQVGRELGVRYVLEGSVRKAAGRLRVAGQLVDAMTGAHLWADRFEGSLDDVFALQDEVTLNVVSAIQPKLLQTEMQLATRRRPNNLSAYDLYLRAAAHCYTMTREGTTEALRLLSRALEIDPRNGFAASLAAACHIQNIGQGWSADKISETLETTRLLRLALSIDESDPEALCLAGRVTAYLGSDFEAAKEMVDRAVSLNPNSALAWEQRGWAYEYAGESEEAVRSFERANRLSPLDPLLFSTLTGSSLALIRLGRFDEAVAAAKRAIRKNPNFSSAYRCLAAALAHLGREEEARDAAARILDLDPGFRISEWVKRGGNVRSQAYIDGLRKTGLPE